MHSVSIVLLLASWLLVLQAFKLPGRWNFKRLTILASSRKDFYKTDEVYIGNIPSTISTDQLSAELQERGVIGCSEISMFSYGTSEGDKYASLKFEDDSMAIAAVKALKYARLAGFSADVTLMPIVSSISVELQEDGEDYEKFKEYVLKLADKSTDVTVKPTFLDEFKRAYLTCKSPQHTPRVFLKLIEAFGQDKAVHFRLVSDQT